MTAREINQGILNVFRDRPDKWDIRLHLQVHDSLLLSYREEYEEEVIPWALKKMKITLGLARGRDFHVPVEAKVGWNWGESSNDNKTITNPNGLIKWKGYDSRRREKG
jgi:DNA polymerase I-like protein with 3'-5' exonuclease and polymerase domains